jgi:tRNA A-37 threonylcarbamoyl transferase component Bud32
MPLKLEAESMRARLDQRAPSLNDGQTLVDLVCQVGLTSHGRPELGTFAGEYQLLEEVGRGAFGTVYRAIHPVIGKEVAIKVLDESSLDDTSLEQRFVTEARAVNRIKHPNIVDIFGFGELPNGQKFYVMELLTGETLAALRKRAGALPQRVALEILEPLSDALDAAHDVGILHRDLKPANVFLHRAADGSVSVKLLDFGVAKVLGGRDTAHTRTGGPVGTPAYMAPEQWTGGSAAAAADVYSLGVIAYELLTGRRPFAPSEVRDRFKQKSYSPPDSASRINPQLPHAVDALLARMLAQRPADRPHSARTAVTLLRQALLSSDSALAVLAVDPGTLPVEKVVIGQKVMARRRLGVWVGLGAVAAIAAWGIAGRRAPSSPLELSVNRDEPASAAAPSVELRADVNPPVALESLPSTTGDARVVVKLAPADEPATVPRSSRPAPRPPRTSGRKPRPAPVSELEY